MTATAKQLTERSARLVRIARRLSSAVGKLEFGPPVSHVYNPLDYARAAHEEYLSRFGEGAGRVMLMGMNPGPWGMTQTGVPFGEVSAVRDWLKIEERIDRPVDEHPRRRVDGFDCTRSEVSGARLWGAIAERRFRTKSHFVSIGLSFFRGKRIAPVESLQPLRRAIAGARWRRCSG